MLVKDIFIYEMESVKDALKKLDRTGKKVLLVVDNDDRLLGTITDGDVRRYILKGKDLQDDIREMYNKRPILLRKRGFAMDAARELFIEAGALLIPIVDEERRVTDFITWGEIFGKDKKMVPETRKVGVPLVIMAGGKGERLEPFNKIFPKPLIPVGDKPIIEIIIDEFRRQGVKDYYLIVNYKGEIIESYFSGIQRDYNVTFVRETDFLGTAGSLKLLRDTIADTFIVSNCDVIIRANFAEVVDFHKNHHADLTVLSAIQHYKIPYGIIKFREGGEVVDVSEKPEYTFTVNAGLYVLAKTTLDLIQDGKPLDMTDLIKNLITHNRKVVTYPVNENDYVDIGQWEEYKKAVEKIKLLA